MPIYITDKPLGWTSHDVVAKARKQLQTKRVGHTGTLDPLATGVLVVCSEHSTKLVQFLTADSKAYLAWIALGVGTPTLDAEGPIVEQHACAVPNAETLNRVLQSFLGDQQQIPPQYSAIQQDGVRAYDVARSGGSLDLPARSVHIHALEVLATFESVQEAHQQRFSPDVTGRYRLDPEGQEFTLPTPLAECPTLLLHAEVGSGTYLRSLARDIGAALGVPAHLAGLVRTRVGRFSLVQAQDAMTLATATDVPELDALELPQFEVDAALARAIREGKKPAADREGRWVMVYQGRIVAIVDVIAGHYKVVRAWADV